MDRFSGRDDGDVAAPRPGHGQIARGGLHAFVKSASTIGSKANEQRPSSGPSVTLSRTEQAQKVRTAETAKRVTAAVAAAVAADPRPISGFQPPSWASLPPQGLALQGKKAGEVVQHLPLSKLAVLIGRLENADLQLEHASISRQHAVLCFRPDGAAVIMDLNSAHGTFLDGKRLLKHTPSVLDKGVELRFGASTRAFSLCRNPKHTDSTNKKRSVQWPDESEGATTLPRTSALELKAGHLMLSWTPNNTSCRSRRSDVLIPSLQSDKGDTTLMSTKFVRAGSKKQAPSDLATVIGFSDGGSFSAGVGPSAAMEKQVTLLLPWIHASPPFSKNRLMAQVRAPDKVARLMLQGRFATAISHVTKRGPRQAPTPIPAAAEPSESSPDKASTESHESVAGVPSRSAANGDEDKAATLKRLAAERFRQFMQSNSQKQSSFYDELPPPNADKASRVATPVLPP